MTKKTLTLAEYFNSIQGEFPDVGTPYTFVRFKACNLHCPFCYYQDNDKTYPVYDISANSWLDITDIKEAYSKGYLIAASKTSVTEIHHLSTIAFSNYYEVTVRGILSGKEKTFKLSFDHLLACIPKANVKDCNFGYDFLVDKYEDFNAQRAYTWIPASNLDVYKDEVYLEGRTELYEIVSCQLVDEPIELISLGTGSHTFVYGDLIHHNCDSQLVMRYNRVQVTTKDILDKVQETGSILFTGGEPGLHLSQIKATLDYLAAKKTMLYSLAVETNGYKIHETYKLLKHIQKIIAEYQDFEPQLIIAWSPKMYDNDSYEYSLQVLDQVVKYNVFPVYIKPVYEENRKDTLAEFLERAISKLGERVRWHIAIMPEASDKSKLLDTSYMRKVIDFARSFKVGFSPRLHLLYDLD